jgi:hypothetical protein
MILGWSMLRVASLNGVLLAAAAGVGCWLQAAEAGDMAEAHHLWSSLQAVGLKPSHTFMNGFLM